MTRRSIHCAWLCAVLWSCGGARGNLQQPKRSPSDANQPSALECLFGIQDLPTPAGAASVSVGANLVPPPRLPQPNRAPRCAVSRTTHFANWGTARDAGVIFRNNAHKPICYLLSKRLPGEWQRLEQPSEDAQLNNSELAALMLEPGNWRFAAVTCDLEDLWSADVQVHGIAPTIQIDYLEPINPPLEQAGTTPRSTPVTATKHSSNIEQ